MRGEVQDERGRAITVAGRERGGQYEQPGTDATAADAIAVIGAGGFLGRSLCAALRGNGTRLAELTRSVAWAEGTALAGASTIYFLASSISPAAAEHAPASIAREVEALEACLAAVARLGTRPKVVLPSSGGRVYDVSLPPPYRESSPLRARDRYGEAKLELERRLLAARDVCRPVVLRISNVHGPRQLVRDEHGVVAHWLAAASRGEPITLYGDPAACRDYVYIDDVVSAFLAVHSHADPPEIVNIGSGTPTSLERLAALVSEIAGGVAVRAEPTRGFDPHRTWLDVGLARETLGWTATVPLAEGLARTWAHRGWEHDDSGSWSGAGRQCDPGPPDAD